MHRGCKKSPFAEFDNFLHLLNSVCLNILAGSSLERCNALMTSLLYTFVVKRLSKGLVFLTSSSPHEFVFNSSDTDGRNLFVLFISLKIPLRIPQKFWKKIMLKLYQFFKSLKNTLLYNTKKTSIIFRPFASQKQFP